MSADDFKLDVMPREVSGKGASRRLRREANLVPAIIYGGTKKPQNITIKANELFKHLDNEAFYSHIITLNVNGKSEDVILKDLQRHPAKTMIYHADFFRISKTKKLTTRVPLHYINESTSKGVKTQGGQVSHSMIDIEISCLPGDLPEYIEVDFQDVELGQTVHISNVAFPKGVESVALSHGPDHDLPIANIHKPKGASETSSDSEEEGGEEG
ncbi:MAG: large subunit ribosomal protein L25 [Lentisphaeria bacterium]|jgi:large subunit ribosomal protein L25